jgi:hypothetical protein
VKYQRYFQQKGQATKIPPTHLKRANVRLSPGRQANVSSNMLRTLPEKSNPIKNPGLERALLILFFQ